MKNITNVEDPQSYIKRIEKQTEQIKRWLIIIIFPVVIFGVCFGWAFEVKKDRDIVWQEISQSIEQDLKEKYGEDINIQKLGSKLLINFTYGKSRSVYEITIKNFQILYD